MDMSLRDRAAIITGGGSGLGEATALALATEGVAIAVVDLSSERAEAVASRLRDTGAKAIATQADVSDANQIRRVVETALAAFGRVDFMVNNAGTDYVIPITEMTIEQFDRVQSVNLRAAFVFAKELFPVMQRLGGGHFVNIASTASKRAWANASAYHASKWGLIGFTQALGVEGRPFHIKATTIIPGGMRTHFFDKLDPPPDVSNLQDPANVARVIVFALAQPAETVIQEVLVTPLSETSWP